MPTRRPAPAVPPSTVRRTELPSGLVVLTEEMPWVRTAAVAVHVLSGSRDEGEGQGGMAHFLEHFLFRGTSDRPGGRARTALEIATEIDELGGAVDAYTTRESASYGAAVASEALPQAARLLADLIGGPALPADDLERERAVVREELRGYDDSPVDLAFDLSMGLQWPDHPLGRPVQGREEDVERLTLDGVRAAWERAHVRANLLVVAAGALEHDAVVALVEEGLGGLPSGPVPRGPVAPAPGRRVVVERRAHLEQAQVVLSLPGLPLGHPDETALEVLTTALGDGLSSRLWQRVREREGLAYDISLSPVAFRDAGRVVLHAGAAAENVERLLAIVRAELDDVRREGLRPRELDRARACLRSGLVLGLEGPGARASELAAGQVVHGRPVPLEEQLGWVDAVTADGVAALADRLFSDPARTLLVLGPDDVPDLADDAA